MTDDLNKIYISCALGLESALLQECMVAGINVINSTKNNPSNDELPAGEEKGGFEFIGTKEQLYQVNLQLRTASRVIVRLGEFYAAAFSELRKKASRLEWERYLKPGQSVSIKVTCHKSKLYHSDAVAERVLGAIEDSLHVPVKIAKENEPSQLILVRLTNNLCTISIDSSGDLLHRRGYRQAVAKAPLRETLAAGLIISSGWTPEYPLIDPFCGSGTIPIEAVLMARDIAPGINRRFSFMDWPGFNQELFSSCLSTCKKAIQKTDQFFYASDRDHGAIEMAKSNAARTDVNGNINFVCHAISDLPAHEGQPGYLITNPPYGLRVSPSKDLRNLYASFGKVLRENFSGWHVSVLCNDDALISAMEIGKAQNVIKLINGGIPVKYSQFSL